MPVLTSSELERWSLHCRRWLSLSSDCRSFCSSRERALRPRCDCRTSAALWKWAECKATCSSRFITSETNREDSEKVEALIFTMYSIVDYLDCTYCLAVTESCAIPWSYTIWSVLLAVIGTVAYNQNIYVRFTNSVTCRHNDCALVQTKHRRLKWIVTYNPVQQGFLVLSEPLTKPYLVYSSMRCLLSLLNKVLQL